MRERMYALGMNTHTSTWLAIALAAAFSFLSAALVAGPLTPPAGPVVATNKTLAEVEPRIAVNASNTPGDATASFIIATPGSYYLTGNITGASAKSGIRIASSNVTLDLNGFTLQGVSGSLDGVIVSTSGLGITIRNGSVSAWGQDGIDFGNALSYLAESLHAHSNTGVGIRGAFTGTIRDCTARANGGDGIRAGDPSVVERCAAVANGGAGISCPFGNCLVSHCVAEVNTGAGISVADSCTVLNNTCSINTGPQLLVTLGENRIDSNNLVGTIGLRVTGSGNVIVRNSASNNSTAYDIAANNRYGTIVNITAAGAAAVAGASAVSTLTTTDPWANFAY